MNMLRLQVVANLAALLLASLFSSDGIFAATAVPPGYKLVWADEFDGRAVDESAWNYRLGSKKFSRCSKKDVSLVDGAMKISLVRRGDSFGGGGLITKRSFRSGYFETSVKTDGGPGWHEAFWTCWADSVATLKAPEIKTPARIEIDCFEQTGSLDERRFSYGAIQWHPLHGGIIRKIHETDADLSAGFHTYGFECSDDYVAFFFDGEMLATAGLRGIGQTKFHVWLSCIAMAPNAQAKNGAVLFDYLRCYEIDPAAYPTRRDAVLAAMAAVERSDITPRPADVDYWVEAEDFAVPGTWKKERDGSAIILKGREKKDPALSETDLTARTAIRIAQAGAYRLWVRACDYEKSMPGRRTFTAAVNGMSAGKTFGTHGKEGYEWQDGGMFELPAGAITLELTDVSQYFARCDRLLLTRDLEYVPKGPGGAANADHTAAQ